MNSVVSLLVILSSLGVYSEVPPDGLYRIYNVASGKPLDCSSNDIVTTSFINANQIFKLTALSGTYAGSFQIKCMNNGKCLDYQGVPQTIGTNSKCYTTTDQRYWFTALSSGQFRYEIRVNNGMRYLEVNGGSLLETNPTRTSAVQQYFILEQVDCLN